MNNLDFRYAVSMYVDLRLGVLTGDVFEPETAQEIVAERFGDNAAQYAASRCETGSRNRERRGRHG